MLRTVFLLSSICGFVRSSGVAIGPLASGAHVAAVGPPVAHAPVVTAASSQYFERTFNRLVVPQVVAPVAPVGPPPLAPIPVAPAPPVFVEPTRSIPVAVNPPPPQEVQPNVAIAVATAHAAAPVATILLPPYPFGFPPTFGLIPSQQPFNIPDENTKEPTTQRTTEAEATTTPEPETTTPIDASSSDNSFVQALPSNEKVNFNLYGPPPQGPRPQFQPQQPGPQFQPQQPNPQFQPQQPNPHFKPQQPNPQFQPQQPQFQHQQPQFQPQKPQFQPQQPQFQPQKPQFQPQKPQFQPQKPQFQPQQPQFQPQKPQFQPQQPQFQQQQPQFKPQQSQFHQQQPEFPPYPPKQQPRPQFQPQPRPQYQPQQHWPQQNGRPQKIKTSVEVVPVPLAYITPPPLHKTHARVKVVKHIYTYVPSSSAKIILKPVKIRPVRLVKHKIVRSQNLRANARDIEVTTFNPFPRPNTKPPRV